MHPPGVPIGGHSALGTNVPGPPPHRSQVAGLTLGPLTQLPSGQLQQLGVPSVVVVAGSVDDVGAVVVVSVDGVLGSVVDVVVTSVVVKRVVVEVVVLVAGAAV